MLNVLLDRSARRAPRALSGLTVILLGLGGLAGCASPSAAKGGGPEAAASASGDPLAGIFGPAPRKGGTQLWTENCARCHYARAPNYYSADQWAIVMQHMRSRANVTGEEGRTILAFLQAGAGAPD